MSKREQLQWLLEQATPERIARLRTLSPAEQRTLAYHWRLWARDEQLEPAGDWRVWLILAGRGFGKTRAGAEWVRAAASARPDARIALVGSSLGEARAVMVERGKRAPRRERSGQPSHLRAVPAPPYLVQWRDCDTLFSRGA